MARSGHGTDIWSAEQVTSELAGLNGQSSGWHPQTAGIRRLLQVRINTSLEQGKDSAFTLVTRTGASMAEFIKAEFQV